MALTGSDLGAMEISLEPAVATAPTVPTADAGGDPATVYLTRLTSAESRRAMATSLELLAELLVDGHPADRTERARRRRDGTPLAMAVPWHELRYGHTQALRSWLAEHCSPAAANRHLAALRGVLRETWRLGLMGGEDLARAIDLASVPGTSLPAGRYVEDGEVRRLVAACLADQSPGGRRDAAVLAALFVGGLRRAEAVALDVEHYEPASGHLTITGRGDVSAAPPFPPAVAGLWPHGSRFGAWRPAVLPGRQGRPGHPPPPAVYALVDRRARKARVSHLSPHDGRRIFASDLFDTGVDAVQVGRLMGHASLLTTGAYDRRPELTRLAAVERLHFPYPSWNEPQDNADRTPVIGPGDQARGVGSGPRPPV